MAHFFATAEDLLPVLLSVEARHPIKYTPTEYVSKPRVKHYSTARDLPTLFKPQPYESAVGGPAYLVTEADAKVALRRINHNDGSVRWAIDQAANEDSVVLRHGGVYGDHTLLPGEVGTAYKTPVAVQLRRAFDEAVRKRFVRIGVYYVGSEAEKLLDSGWRLTAAEQCPPEYDLRRSKGRTRRAKAVQKRRSLAVTWRALEREGWKMPRLPNGKPSVPKTMPNYDDDHPRFSFFRTGLEDDDLSKLTLPRTYFGRSGFTYVSFVDTDLSESRMCWNDFDDCDFSGADLSGCDMRASRFTGCKFVGANLRGADLRRSTFVECDFKKADLMKAVAEDEDFDGCVLDWLTAKQQKSMTWTEEGPEPPGG